MAVVIEFADECLQTPTGRVRLIGAQFNGKEQAASDASDVGLAASIYGYGSSRVALSAASENAGKPDGSGRLIRKCHHEDPAGFSQVVQPRYGRKIAGAGLTRYPRIICAIDGYAISSWASTRIR